MRTFFFYGTLIAGSGNAVEAAAHRKLLLVGPGSVRGRLYAIRDPAGWYPALLPGSGRVRGAVYETALDFAPADLARLDAYEGHERRQISASPYLRRPIRVSCGGAHGLVAEAYVFNRKLPPGSRRIAGGDFHGWLEKYGFVAYGGP